MGSIILNKIDSVELNQLPTLIHLKRRGAYLKTEGTGVHLGMEPKNILIHSNAVHSGAPNSKTLRFTCC